MGHQPAEGAGAERVAGDPVDAPVGEVPADHPDRQAEQERAERGGGATEQADEDERPPVT